MFPLDVVSTLKSGHMMQPSAQCLVHRVQGLPNVHWPYSWANPHEQATVSGYDCWSGHSFAPESQVFWHAWTSACEADQSSQTLDELFWVPQQHQHFPSLTCLMSEQVFVYVANGHDAVTSFLGLCSYCCARPVFHNYVIAGSVWTPAIKGRA